MYNNDVNERKWFRQFRRFEAQIQNDRRFRVIKEKVNPLARYYNFFRYSAASETASEAGDEEEKKGNISRFRVSGLVTATRLPSSSFSSRLSLA